MGSLPVQPAPPSRLADILGSGHPLYGTHTAATVCTTSCNEPHAASELEARVRNIFPLPDRRQLPNYPPANAANVVFADESGNNGLLHRQPASRGCVPWKGKSTIHRQAHILHFLRAQRSRHKRHQPDLSLMGCKRSSTSWSLTPQTSPIFSTFPVELTALRSTVGNHAKSQPQIGGIWDQELPYDNGWKAWLDTLISTPSSVWSLYLWFVAW